MSYARQTSCVWGQGPYDFFCIALASCSFFLVLTVNGICSFWHLTRIWEMVNHLPKISGTNELMNMKLLLRKGLNWCLEIWGEASFWDADFVFKAEYLLFPQYATMYCCKFDLSRHRFRYPGSPSADKDLDIVGPVDLAIQGHEFDEEFQYCPISGS